MSVTPSLKDKVEFTLDNRQIFFLFFGLSVVGCFVFAMGVMVGRRGELQEMPAVAQVQQGALALDEPVVADAYAFKDGLQHPATEGLPETRDPEKPPRDEDAVRAEREAALAKGKKPGASTKKLPPIPAPSQKPAMASAPKMMPPLAGADVPAPAVVKQPEPVAEPAVKPMDPPAVAIVEKPKDSLLTAVKGDQAPAGPAAKKNYTLQMKAFSSAEDAEKLADRLRRNGHDVRVETGEANGRTWHRVRMGHFDSWDAAVSAKANFEKNEQVIAYVVTL